MAVSIAVCLLASLGKEADGSLLYDAKTAPLPVKNCSTWQIIHSFNTYVVEF